MKFTLSWLKDHLETNADIGHITDTLTAVGLEVESVNSPQESLKAFVTAKIISVKKHPNADKLMLLQIDIGAVQKQIVAGIRGHYEPDQLTGRQIVVVNNLETALIRGEESQGMLLAASSGESVVLLRPDVKCETGAKIK